MVVDFRFGIQGAWRTIIIDGNGTGTTGSGVCTCRPHRVVNDGFCPRFCHTGFVFVRFATSWLGTIRFSFALNVITGWRRWWMMRVLRSRITWNSGVGFALSFKRIRRGHMNRTCSRSSCWLRKADTWTLVLRYIWNFGSSTRLMWW